MAVVLGTSSGFVRVAPTADPAGSNTTIDGSSVVTKDTTPAGARTITEIGWYRGSGTNTANFEVALYADSAGAAGARLNVDNTNSSAVQGWVVTAVNWTISPNTAYWLAVQMDAHSGSSTIDTATPGGSGSDVLTSQTTLNDPYGGGAVADAAGMYAIYALVTGTEVNATPGVGAVDLTGFAPTIQTPRNVTPDVGALTLTGLAPTVVATSNTAVTAGVGALALTGFAPSVAVTANLALTPGVGALALTGFAPTIQTPVALLPGTGALDVTGYAPTVATPMGVTTDLGVLTLAGFAPTVTVAAAPSSAEVTPDVGVLTLTGYAPTATVTTTTATGGGGGPAPSLADFRLRMFPPRRRHPPRESEREPQESPEVPRRQATPKAKAAAPTPPTRRVAADDTDDLLVLLDLLD